MPGRRGGICRWIRFYVGRIVVRPAKRASRIVFLCGRFGSADLNSTFPRLGPSLFLALMTNYIL